MSSETYERTLLRRFLCWLGLHDTIPHVSGLWRKCVHCGHELVNL